jgi:hypothetical protein
VLAGRPSLDEGGDDAIHALNHLEGLELGASRHGAARAHRRGAGHSTTSAPARSSR